MADQSKDLRLGIIIGMTLARRVTSTVQALMESWNLSPSDMMTDDVRAATKDVLDVTVRLRGEN
jgi:hypothetical protein